MELITIYGREEIVFHMPIVLGEGGTILVLGPVDLFPFFDSFRVKRKLLSFALARSVTWRIRRLKRRSRTGFEPENPNSTSFQGIHRSLYTFARAG
jgi:hypothetical protein